ncbi:putative nuclease HARBI1 [Ochlerotatus camptorhynchus]|uniref:putative nuclease HARBI1 n=1 Tax=Ochlerotatus camptorhynchus TaxID=644619 RepID=UPI0031D4C39F
MSSYEFWFSDEEDEIEDLHFEMVRIERSRLRDLSNPLDMPSNLFLNYFRVSKELFSCLLNIVDGKLGGTKSSSVQPILKLSAALRFFAEGSYQKGVGNDFFAGMAQPTLSKALSAVIDVFEAEICPAAIKFPVSEVEKREIKHSFYEKSGFPSVIGCVDGTHVRIVKPVGDIQHLYYNRKGFHSLNVMLVCDHKQMIRYVDANSPGANHDSFIWNNNPLDFELSQQYQNGERNTWLLGDAGYPLKPYLITPFRSSGDARQTKFNEIHSKTRMLIERTIGVMKNVFRCILGARQLHYKPEKAAKIVNVCCALHNLRKQFNLPDDNFDELIDIHQIEDNAHDDENDASANEIRQQIMYSIA